MRTRYTGMKNKYVLHDSKVSSQEGIFLSFFLSFLFFFFNQKKFRVRVWVGGGMGRGVGLRGW